MYDATVLKLKLCRSEPSSCGRLDLFPLKIKSDTSVWL